MSNYCWDITHGDEPKPKSRCVDCLKARVALLEAAIQKHHATNSVICRHDRELYAVLQKQEE